MKIHYLLCKYNPQWQYSQNGYFSKRDIPRFLQKTLVNKWKYCKKTLENKWKTDGIAKRLEFKCMYFFEILQNYGKSWSSVFRKPWETNKPNGNTGHSENTEN